MCLVMFGVFDANLPFYKWLLSCHINGPILVQKIYICKSALPTQYDKYCGKNYCGAAEKEITDCA